PIVLPISLPLSCASCAVLRALHSFPTRRSSDLLSAKRQEVQDWLVLWIFNHLFSGGVWDLGGQRDGRTGGQEDEGGQGDQPNEGDRKSTRLNSSHGSISYAVFCLKKKMQEASS